MPRGPVKVLLVQWAVQLQVRHQFLDGRRVNHLNALAAPAAAPAEHGRHMMFPGITRKHYEDDLPR